MVRFFYLTRWNIHKRIKYLNNHELLFKRVCYSLKTRHIGTTYLFKNKYIVWFQDCSCVFFYCHLKSGFENFSNITFRLCTFCTHFFYPFLLNTHSYTYTHVSVLTCHTPSPRLAPKTRRIETFFFPNSGLLSRLPYPNPAGEMASHAPLDLCQNDSCRKVKPFYFYLITLTMCTQDRLQCLFYLSTLLIII